MTIQHRWQPIEPLTEFEERIAHGLQPLTEVWREAQARLQEEAPYGLQQFNERLVRRLSVETGIIERLYDVDRGTTNVLVEHGFREDLIPRESTNVDPAHLATVLSDHESAWTLVQQCVGGARELTIGLIHELHQAYTAHQPAVTAYDREGRMYETRLLRGAFKVHPNSVTLRSGAVHEYCPPLQVAPEMERLLSLLAEYQDKDPIVVAAWLHHRFVQIHPYQDGNGRVARALMGLSLLRAGLLPIVVDRDDRTEYIDALEAADAGDLVPLVRFLVRLEETAIIEGLNLQTGPLEQPSASATGTELARIEARFKRRERDAIVEWGTVNHLAIRLAIRTEHALNSLLNSLSGIIRREHGSGSASFRHDVVGTDIQERGVVGSRDPNLYQNLVTRAANAQGREVDFNEPHYYVAKMMVEERETIRRTFAFVVSLHHTGPWHGGIMEARAFYAAEAEVRAPSEQPYEVSSDVPPDILKPCSLGQFVFTYKSLLEEIVPSLESWLDKAFAEAVREYGALL
ncbi:MAG: Fic family protein [Chloroflexi bacterium]|nr:Fic family protein [Chloroflexota bacterium]